MLYTSTRQGSAAPEAPRQFCDILLEGLAPDGGLYLPEFYPQVTAQTLQHWRGLSYADLAFEVLSLYIDDIPADDLRTLVQRTYRSEVFGGHAEIAPVTSLEQQGQPSGLYLQGLSYGPTLAFKDMAMQLLGNLFEYELHRRGQTLNILGATSGDTGSAAEYAMRGKEGIRVFMLSPNGRMSPFQQAQMFSLQDENIHNIAVEGVFDDCQDMVKAVSADLEFKRSFAIGTVNSINWARLLAQVVYYFAGYFQALRLTNTDANLEAVPLSQWPQVSFTVPSGNFGNVCAGHVSRMMGLPIDQLVVATNENDVLDEFFRTGRYRVRTSENTFETSSPSMDISKASNFERFIFDVLGRDGVATAQCFSQNLSQHGEFALSESQMQVVRRCGFISGRSQHSERLQTIRDADQRFGVVIDTHTADGLKVAQEHRRDGIPMIVLETALPAKFAQTIVEALGREPSRPLALQGIESLPKRFVVMSTDVLALKQCIEQVCQ